MKFNGLNMGLGILSRYSTAKSRSISAENFNGEKGKGGMAQEGTGKQCADELGAPWKISPSYEIPAGETLEAAKIDGSGAIQSIWISGGVVNDLIIRFYWDNSPTPSVECPLPFFFGFGWNNVYNNADNDKFPILNSIPVMVAPRRGFNCFWEMPFKKNCRITIENRFHKPVTVYYQINYTLTDVPEDCGYFHAQFRLEKHLEYKKNYLIVDDIKGKGHYIGTALFVGLNSDNRWWGEGEIKFFMDGDKDFPTICGTGTEDYFGGAYDWDNNGTYTTYSTPYMGMYQVIKPDGLYDIQQRFSMYRWHIMDPIRFEEDLRVELQDIGWKIKQDGIYKVRRDDFYSVAYWYGELGKSDFPKLCKNEELDF